MHVLITGGRGQLGQAIANAFGERGRADLTIWNRPEYDISDPAIGDRVCALQPDLVINAAAWTNVDGAEENVDATYAVNALGPRYLAEACHHCNADMVQISSNEVFAGEPRQFYREYDQPNPRSTYACSKLAGELAAREMLSHLYVVRIAWLFGIGNNNFPSKIISAAQKHGKLRVVNDEFGNPTYAPDLADALVKLVQSKRYGTYHLVNDGMASRYQWAKDVLANVGLSEIEVTPILGSEWERPTTPPSHAVLVNQSAATMGIRLRSWQDALSEYATQIFKEPVV